MSTRGEQARRLQGRRAGFPTRIIVGAIDLVILFAIVELVLFGYGLVRALVTEKQFAMPIPPAWLALMGMILLLIGGLAIMWSGSGRTLGDSLMGLRVVTDRGERLTFGRAVARAVVLVVLPVISMAWILVSRKNAALHDLACRTTVMYDWQPREKLVPGTVAPVAIAADATESRRLSTASSSESNAKPRG